MTTAHDWFVMAGIWVFMLVCMALWEGGKAVVRWHRSLPDVLPAGRNPPPTAEQRAHGKRMLDEMQRAARARTQCIQIDAQIVPWALRTEPVWACKITWKDGTVSYVQSSWALRDDLASDCLWFTNDEPIRLANVWSMRLFGY